MSRFSDSLKKGFRSESRKVRRLSRTGYLDYCNFKKTAQEEQHGILQHFRSENRGYPTRDQYHTMRGVPSSPSPGQTPSDGSEISRLYGVNPQQEDSELIEMNRTRSLSTRYSPDRVGVQARRVSDGVWQDPYTNRVYDYNDGFKTESGEEFPGGHVALQSHMIGLASHLDSIGLYKEADYLDALIKKKSSSEERDLELFRNSIGKQVSGSGYPGATIAGPPSMGPDGDEYLVPLYTSGPEPDYVPMKMLSIVTEEGFVYNEPDDSTDRERELLMGAALGIGGPDSYSSRSREEEVDYRRAVSSAIQILRSISRSAPGMNRRNAYELMEVVFEQLAGEGAADALNAERAIIDEASRESGSGRGFLG